MSNQHLNIAAVRCNPAHQLPYLLILEIGHGKILNMVIQFNPQVADTIPCGIMGIITFEVGA